MPTRQSFNRRTLDQLSEDMHDGTFPVTPQRPHTARFIVIFVVCVLGLLTGYRMLIGTRVNDWYLFQVARHTAATLDLMGESAELERTPIGGDPQELRARIAAWREGLDEPTVEEIAAESTEPLTAYERYLYRLASGRHAGSRQAEGPRVFFVWKRGLQDELREREAELVKLGSEAPERAALEQEIVRLRAEMQPVRDDPERQHAVRGASFSFRVVPECGAIEVMAIFTAAVLAFPTRWRRKLVGIIFGLPLLYLVNVGRLSCLGLIGAYTTDDAWFNFAHEYVWQAIYIVFVVALWLAWVELVVRRRA